MILQVIGLVFGSVFLLLGLLLFWTSLNNPSPEAADPEDGSNAMTGATLASIGIFLLVLFF